MSDKEKAVIAASEAAKEIATLGQMGTGAVKGMGQFIGRFIEGPLEQASGIVTDHLRYVRGERALRLQKRAQELFVELGMDGPTRSVPLKVMIPLLSEATIEEDDDLQDMWARLLVNAGDADHDVEVRRAFVSILRDFGSLEARIMQGIYAYPQEKLLKECVRTRYLPETIVLGRDEEGDVEHIKPDVKVALSNLCRLECLNSNLTYGGTRILSQVYPTELGRRLMDACTLRSK